MKILVTGGAGFIGSHIVDLLIENKHDVSIVDNLSTGRKENINKMAEFYCVDINSNGLEEVFQRVQPEVVIHHAAQIDVQKSIKSPTLDADINIVSTIKLLELCAKYSVMKIIYASSAAVYGIPQSLSIEENHSLSPISFYGISKLTPEYYIKVFSELNGIKYSILRYSNVYGIRQDPRGEGGVISIFLNRLLLNKPIVIYGDGDQTRDFIYVKDIAKANLAALESQDNSVINISTNKTVTINQLYNKMSSLMQKYINPVFENERPGDIKHSCLNNNKANNVLNWYPSYSLDQGLAETISYYTKENNNVCS